MNILKTKCKIIYFGKCCRIKYLLIMILSIILFEFTGIWFKISYNYNMVKFNEKKKQNNFLFS